MTRRKKRSPEERRARKRQRAVESMEASCKGKHRFPSRKDAKRKAGQMRTELGGRLRGELRPYSCEACGFWHLTSAHHVKRASFREALGGEG